VSLFLKLIFAVNNYNMKRILLLAIAPFLWCKASAQMNQYSFSRESGLLMDVDSYPGAQIVNHNVQDDILQPAKMPMPFSFSLGSHQVDTIGIAENGYLFISSLSPFAVSAPWPISTQQPPQVKGIVSALGIDLHPVNIANQKTTIKSALVGTAPLRMFIVEWKHTSTIDALGSGTPDDISFQIKLYETTGRIEIAYGNFVLNPNTSVQAEIGIKGDNFNDYANRSVTSADWSTSIAGSSQMARVPLNVGSKPTFGNLYVWEKLPGTGIGDMDGIQGMTVYPVPARDNLFITVGNESIADCHYVITDLSGRPLKGSSLSHSSIPVAELAPGIYLLQVAIKGSKIVRRFSKY